MPAELASASSGFVHTIAPQCPKDQLWPMWNALEQPGLPLGPFHFSLSRLHAMQQQSPEAQHQDASPTKRKCAIKGKATTRAGKPASSKYKGVNLHCRSGRWDAHIWDGRQVHLGCFLFEVQAAIAYDLMAMKVRGYKAANMNFTLEDYKKEIEELDKISKEVLVASLRVSTTKLRAVTTQLSPESPEMLKLQSMLSSPKPQCKTEPEAAPAPPAPAYHPASSSCSSHGKCSSRPPAAPLLAKRQRFEESPNAYSTISTPPPQPSVLCLRPTHPTPPFAPASPRSLTQHSLERHCAPLPSHPYRAACPPSCHPAPRSAHHHAHPGPISAPSFKATLDWLAQTFPEQSTTAQPLPAGPAASTPPHSLAAPPSSHHTTYDPSDPHPLPNSLRVQLPPHTPRSPALDMHPRTPILSPPASANAPASSWPHPTFTILPPKLRSAAYAAHTHRAPGAPHLPPAIAAPSLPLYHNPHTLFDIPCAPSPSYRSRQGLAHHQQHHHQQHQHHHQQHHHQQHHHQHHHQHQQQQQQQQACSGALQQPSHHQAQAGPTPLRPNRLVGLQSPEEEEEAPYLTSEGSFRSMFHLPGAPEQGSFLSALEHEQGSFLSALEHEQGSFPPAPEPGRHCQLSSFGAASPPPTLPSDSCPSSAAPALQARLGGQQFDVVAESTPAQCGSSSLLSMPSATSTTLSLPEAQHIASVSPYGSTSCSSTPGTASQAPLQRTCSAMTCGGLESPAQRCASPLPLWHPAALTGGSPLQRDAARSCSSPLQYSRLLGSPSVCTPRRDTTARGDRTPLQSAGLPAAPSSPAGSSLQSGAQAQLLQSDAALQAYGEVLQRCELQLGGEQFNGGDSYIALQSFEDEEQYGSPQQYGGACLGDDASLSDVPEELRVCYDLLHQLDSATHLVHDARISLKQWEQDVLGAAGEGGCEGQDMQQQALEEQQAHLAACLQCFVQ